MELQTPISEKLQSIRETLGREYSRPDISKLDSLIKNLWDTTDGLDYLKKRGLNDETIRHFKLGFQTSPSAIAIPVFKNDELVNIKYRFLEPVDNKYSGEHGAESWVFNQDGIHEASKKGFVLVVEGEFDAMSAWQAGVKNVVSPSAGKDSFGGWLELIDNIPRIYIGYDNDEPGKMAARKMAERLGQDRCYSIDYGDCKDPNEFLTKHSVDEFREVLKSSKPFTRQQFKTMGDVIESLRKGEVATISSKFMPQINFEKGWMGIISGRSNVGKTSYVMNIANEFANHNIPTLILPFERGIDSVGRRFLQIREDAGLTELAMYKDEDWDRVMKDASGLPIYFAMPDKDHTVEFISKSKKYFDIQVVIIDHLDYMVRQLSSGSRGDAIMDTLQKLKRIAEDSGIVLLIVSHVRKTERPGGFIARTRKPNIEDLKGSSSLYQDPEVVIMLSETNSLNEISVDVLKNKGEMGDGIYTFNPSTGVYGKTFKHSTSPREIAQVQEASDDLWNSV